jgi:hypothetical protein
MTPARHANYEARWISRSRAHGIRKLGGNGGILVSAYSGTIIVEPKGARLGDGKRLTPGEADYELQPVWCPEAKSKLEGARRLLGLA